MTPAVKIQLLYTPAPEVSKDFKAEFNKIVPICPGNPDARYLRYVWGCDRKEEKGDRSRLRYADPDCKYVGLPRWILEGWQSSDVYNRRDWEENKDVLGDFPNNGVWDFIEIHETDTGEFLPLNETALVRARSWAFWRTKGFERSVEALMAQMAVKEKREKAREDAAAEKVMDDFVDNLIKAEETKNKNVEFSLPPQFKRTMSGLIIPR